MNSKKYNWVLYLISVTIVTTIAVQLYWNYKNYKQNKQYVVNEIQESLDSAIEEYFAKLTKESLFAIVEPRNSSKQDVKKREEILKSIFSPLTSKGRKKDSTHTNVTTKSSLEILTDNTHNFQEINSVLFDSAISDITRKIDKKIPVISGIISRNKETGKHNDSVLSNKTTEVRVYTGKRATDSLKLIKGLQTIFISVKNDTLNHQRLDSLLSNTLTKKGIYSSFYLYHTKNDSLIYTNKKASQTPYKLSAHAKSTYLNLNENVSLFYSNPSYEALRRSSTGILLSCILSLAVIASLFYLLKIINQQKELAEIKNDLISNITHEFKTPITTVSTAIEAIDNFNIIDDKEKTKKYLAISSVQLKKLHQMVEKLLETATLDSEKLLLKKEETDIIELIEKTTKKHQLITNDKNITFSSSLKNYVLPVDPFHFENAVSNLIDNAIKYGGDTIEVNVNVVLNTVEISVADNGKGIEKSQQERIFDKFYRVPKGNTHDVKGFGIGLYYTQKIIEKHGGFILLTSNTKHTIFKISLPNG